MSDDLALIVGSRAIAEALQISVTQFRNARHRGGLLFIWKEPGLGIVTTRAAAGEYLRARASGKAIEMASLDASRGT